MYHHNQPVGPAPPAVTIGRPGLSCSEVSSQKNGSRGRRPPTVVGRSRSTLRTTARQYRPQPTRRTKSERLRDAKGSSR